jgi:ferredoxin
MTQTQPCCSASQEVPQELPRIFVFPYLCNACGTCAEVCPFGLPTQGDNKKYEIKRPDLCTECSACMRNCPTQAIIMQEREGCGCLWDVMRRTKSNAKAENNNAPCCSG